MAIVKEVVTKEATARKIQIQISVDIKDETVGGLLRRLGLGPAGPLGPDSHPHPRRLHPPPAPRPPPPSPPTLNLTKVGDLLRRLDPMLQYQLALTNKAKLIDTLKEVKMQENDISFLAPEYVEIVENEAKIRKELKEQPGRLQFLHGIVTDLFLDKFKFKGQNVAAQAPQLQRLLQHEYSLPALLQFFDQK